MENGLSPANVAHSEGGEDFKSNNLGTVKTEVGNIVGMEVSDEQNRRVLRKIDRWLASAKDMVICHTLTII